MSETRHRVKPPPGEVGFSTSADPESKKQIFFREPHQVDVGDLVRIAHQLEGRIAPDEVERIPGMEGGVVLDSMYAVVKS